MSAESYWAERYSEPFAIAHHTRQNRQIAMDIYRVCHNRWAFTEAFECERIIEIGCGTGELGHFLRSSYSTPWYCATDLSEDAVKIVERRYGLNARQFDIMNDEPFAGADVAISSNTLEHFKDPHSVIERMLDIAPTVVLFVPYRQPLKDHYEVEGGAGHAYSFSKTDFDRYTVLDRVIFKTAGWQHGEADGENPRQLAVVFNA